ncbi:MAG: helix-turn-helix domain-containing protein, partial [Cellulomonadaceae bacterium]|nr:helix-turn-helix domain-containing protein [Cellulomonadaceae bacterium]
MTLVAHEPPIPLSAPGATAPVQLFDSFGGFQEVVGRAFVPLALSSQQRHHFRASVRGAQLREFEIVEIAADAHVVERTRRLCDEGGHQPSYKVSLMIEGSGYICQDGRDVLLAPGDIAVYDTTRPYTLAFDDSFRTIVAMFPQRLLDVPGNQVGQLTATSLGQEDHLGGTVGTMLATAAGRLDQLGTARGWRLVRSTIDLVSVLLREQLSSEHTEPADRILDSVYAHIDEHLDDPDLSPTTVAAAHYISVRYLHLLFSTEGTTISAYVRGMRLERCRADLADPLLLDESVTQIAARWTFTDAAHFSRMFKATYGVTPSSYRHLALG